MCQEHDNIKTEIEIIENKTFENVLPSEIKEEFYNIHCENSIHLEKNELNTRRRDESPCLE